MAAKVYSRAWASDIRFGGEEDDAPFQDKLSSVASNSIGYSLLREARFRKGKSRVAGTETAEACNFMGGNVLDRLWRR